MENEGVDTSATTAACASNLITSLTERAKNLAVKALSATDGCKHVAISMQNASEIGKCNRHVEGRYRPLRASNSDGDRVAVRGPTCLDTAIVAAD